MAALAKETVERSITVPGVQPKLSLGRIRNELNTAGRGRFNRAGCVEGEFILKPPLCRLPAATRKRTPVHETGGLVYPRHRAAKPDPACIGELCYITKRIDRNPGTKNHMIDFQQILELEDKYKRHHGTGGKDHRRIVGEYTVGQTAFFEVRRFQFHHRQQRHAPEKLLHVFVR